jgi:putative heme transporter
MSPPPPQTSTVPRALDVAAQYGWRLLVVAGAAVAVGFLMVQLAALVVPVFVAALLAALLGPMVSWLRAHRVHPVLAAVTGVLSLLLVVVGLVWVVVLQVRAGFADLENRFEQRFDELLAWVSQTFGLVEAQIRADIEHAFDDFDPTAGWFLDGVVSVGGTAAVALAGTALTVFALLFFLLDGRRIWLFTSTVIPRVARGRVDEAASAGWQAVTNFTKVQILVASIDAVGIGIGAWALQLPLVIPIAVVVFLCSFVPIVGAFFAGAVAVLIALVYAGPVTALLMLVVVLVVQQIESMVLQPWVMGSAVRVHPLGIVLAVTAGGFLAGVPGTLFAVPVVAFLNVFIQHLSPPPAAVVGDGQDPPVPGRRRRR